MIDNSNILRQFLSFGDDDFYFVQIIKRRKDNPDMVNGQATIKNYYISSIEEYDKMLPIIKRQCEFENARAYFRVNKRNYKHLSLKVMNRGLVFISSNQYKALRNVFDTIAGEHFNDPVKKWLVDIDTVDLEDNLTVKPLTNDKGMIVGISGENSLSKMVSTIMGLQAQTKHEPMMVYVPTKNGIHIITRPFNLKVFKDKHPKVDVHKDATTLLYCPK